MEALLLIVMAVLLIAALERTNRPQAPYAPGLHGSIDHDDRDWARIKLDLLALGGTRPGSITPPTGTGPAPPEGTPTERGRAPLPMDSLTGLSTG